MKCSDCQDLLSEYIDDELPEPKRALVGSHLENCNGCNMVYQDLNQIVCVSRELPVLAPQNALWERIEREIRELTATARKQPGPWTRFWGYRLQLTLSIPQLAGGTLVLLLVTLAASLSYRPEQTATMKAQEAFLNSARSTVVARPLVNVMNPEEAELYGAIDRLTQAVNQRRVKWDPKMQELFDRNLAIVDRSVAECRQLVLRNPNDQVAREMMIIAYKEKLRLLEQFSSL